MGKTLYETLNDKMTEGTKVGRVSATVEVHLAMQVNINNCMPSFE